MKYLLLSVPQFREFISTRVVNSGKQPIKEQPSARQPSGSRGRQRRLVASTGAPLCACAPGSSSVRAGCAATAWRVRGQGREGRQKDGGEGWGESGGGRGMKVKGEGGNGGGRGMEVGDEGGAVEGEGWRWGTRGERWRARDGGWEVQGEGWGADTVGRWRMRDGGRTPVGDGGWGMRGGRCGAGDGWVPAPAEPRAAVPCRAAVPPAGARGERGAAPAGTEHAVPGLPGHSHSCTAS